MNFAEVNLQVTQDTFSVMTYTVYLSQCRLIHLSHAYVFTYTTELQAEVMNLL